MITLSLMAGNFLSGFIAGIFFDANTGYLLNLFLSMTLCILGVLYSLFVLNHSYEIEQEKKTTFFRIGHLVDAYRSVFQIKENRLEKLVAVFVFFSATICSVTMDFEYMMGQLKYPEFNRAIFSIYAGLKQGQDGVWLVLLLPLILSYIKISDLALIIIFQVATTIGYILPMISDESWPGAAHGWPFWVLCFLYKYAVLEFSQNYHYSQDGIDMCL